MTWTTENRYYSATINLIQVDLPNDATNQVRRKPGLNQRLWLVDLNTSITQTTWKYPYIVQYMAILAAF